MNIIVSLVIGGILIASVLLVSSKILDKEPKQEAQKWVSNLATNAKIKFYVNY